MTSSAEDLELFTRWRAGDNSAGSTLIKRHFAALHRFFSNKARGHEEDLVQTTFVACVEGRDAFRGESSFRTYLFQLARLVLFTHYRRVYRSANIDFTTTSIFDLATSPSDVVARRQEQELLQRALQQVPIDQQIALELTYFEGLAAPDVASVLGIPENTVYSRVRRAKCHLRETLERLCAKPHESARALSLLTRGRGDCSPEA